MSVVRCFNKCLKTTHQKVISFYLSVKGNADAVREIYDGLSVVIVEMCGNVLWQTEMLENS